MLFLTFSNVDVYFLGWEVRWRIYTTKEHLLTIRCIKLVGKKKFASVVLDQEHKNFVVYVVSFSSTTFPSSFPLNIYLSRRPQIAGLIADKALIKVPTKYSYFRGIFSQTWCSNSPNIPRSTTALSN